MFDISGHIKTAAKSTRRDLEVSVFGLNGVNAAVREETMGF
jgi:hypothetical protein